MSEMSTKELLEAIRYPLDTLRAFEKAGEILRAALQLDQERIDWGEKKVAREREFAELEKRRAELTRQVVSLDLQIKAEALLAKIATAEAEFSRQTDRLTGVRREIAEAETKLKKICDAADAEEARRLAVRAQIEKHLNEIIGQ